MQTNSTTDQKREKLILQYNKSERNQIINSSRNFFISLLNNLESIPRSEFERPQKMNEEESILDLARAFKNLNLPEKENDTKKDSNWTRSLQYSNTLTDFDLEPYEYNSWLIQPKPKGKRVIIYTKGSSTIVVAKEGVVTHCKTLLPGGGSSPSTKCQKCVLDCIRDEFDHRRYYILDALLLAGEETYYLDSETRHYFLQSHITKEMQVRTDKNEISIFYPPVLSFNKNNIRFLLNLEIPKEIEGILIFAKDSEYELGNRNEDCYWVRQKTTKKFRDGDVIRMKYDTQKKCFFSKNEKLAVSLQIKRIDSILSKNLDEKWILKHGACYCLSVGFDLSSKVAFQYCGRENSEVCYLEGIDLELKEEEEEKAPHSIKTIESVFDKVKEEILLEDLIEKMKI